MKNVQNILFPVDFSASSIAMAPYVSRAASLLGASVTMIHVVDPREIDLVESMSMYVRSAEDIFDDHQLVRRGKLDMFLTGKLDCLVSRVLLTGDPAAEISGYAKQNESDLVIMPTHSGRFRQMLLGSTTGRVINDVPCPILTSRHAEVIKPRPLSHRKWVCALDASPYAERLLRRGWAIAQQAGVNLSIIHVDDPDFVPKEGQSQSEAQQSLLRVIDELGLMGRVHRKAGPLKAALLREVSTEDADALIIGRNRSGDSGDRLTDLTYALVRDSPFPVISL